MSSSEISQSTIHTKSQLGELLDERVPQFVRCVTHDHALLRIVGCEVVAARAPMCGILSGVVANELNHIGVPTEVRIRDLDGLSRYQRQHVLAVTSVEDKIVIIDQTYSQFFSDFGLRYMQLRKNANGHKLYPPELYVAFGIDDTQIVADWAAQLVGQYWQMFGYCDSMQRAYNYKIDDDGWNAPTQVVRQPTHQAVSSYFTNLWDLSFYRPHSFSEEMQGDIDRIAGAAVASLVTT